MNFTPSVIMCSRNSFVIVYLIRKQFTRPPPDDRLCGFLQSFNSSSFFLFFINYSFFFSLYSNKQPWMVTIIKVCLDLKWISTESPQTHGKYRFIYYIIPSILNPEKCKKNIREIRHI